MPSYTFLLALAAAPLTLACPVKSKSSSAALSTSTSTPVATSTVVVEPTSTSVVESSSTTVVFTSTSTSTSAPTSTAAASSTASSSSVSAESDTSAITGTSTFYGGNLNGGTCSFTTLSDLPSGIYGTAYSGEVWDNAAECGACLEVTGPSGNSILVMVVDQCPECDEGHLDLFEDAFEQLGATSLGEISTSYVPVACGITSPFVLHNKSGTSAYWFSMQVVGANEPVASLEVSTDGGSTWQSTTRQSYNFFENASGFGTDTVDVRVTSTTGTSVVVSGVSVASDSTATASANF
ncbi:RlpA-like double-psi beta-barrel-protein domain-containing protein-containing protein [Xylariales sp. PMI_506]|nr:RlpA-like double-psi beta-barrel-protein domain-containing protein-containing protein [Xylariales sp. PMI_506]